MKVHGSSVVSDRPPPMVPDVPFATFEASDGTFSGPFVSPTDAACPLGDSLVKIALSPGPSGRGLITTLGSGGPSVKFD